VEYIFSVVAEFIIQYFDRICFRIKPDEKIFVVKTHHRAIVTGCGIGLKVRSMTDVFFGHLPPVGGLCLKADALQTISGSMPPV
jgi:hypothetical protein